MKPALAIATLIASTSALAIGMALAADDQRPTAARVASTDRVVAIAAGDDVDDAILVGPSGQAYVGADGAWTRRAGGGVAGDVTGAVIAGGELVVAGKAFPAFRRDGQIWFALRLGERGRTVLGAGPAPAIAVGPDVYVYDKASWKKLGKVAGKVAAVWASGAKTAWVATDQGLFRLRGRGFVKAGDTTARLVGGRPYAVDGDAVRDLTRGTAIRATLDGTAVRLVAAASHGSGALHVVADTGAALVLARLDGKQLVRLGDLPGTAQVAAMTVDGAGDLLIAFADGTIALRRGEAWTATAVADALPADGRGPRPAHTR